MKLSCIFGTYLSLARCATAHMEMKEPAPFRSQYNEFSKRIDYDMTSPLKLDGSDFPCKGYANLLGTAEGQPVAEWTSGETYSMTITGDTFHNGGSCQASISYDRGRSWKVFHSYIGSCPGEGQSSYNFTLPHIMNSGDVLFAWSWFNNEGNREMYMNCAAIRVKSSVELATESVKDTLDNRPDMFVANVGNGKCTYEGTDVNFPEPGPAVTINSEHAHAPGNGDCGMWGGK